MTSSNAVHPPIVPPRMAPSRCLDDSDIVEPGVAGASVEVGDGFKVEVGDGREAAGAII